MFAAERGLLWNSFCLLARVEYRSRMLGESERGRGGDAYSFVACFSRLTIYHASLSRRSTVSTPNKDASNTWALITFFPCTRITYWYFLLIVSPSCFTVCGHHLLSMIAICFSLLSSVPNFSRPHSSSLRGRRRGREKERRPDREQEKQR